MECHPVRLEMSKHGCSSSIKIDLAFQLYIYLCEDMKAWYIRHEYSPNLDLIFILAKRESDGANSDVFVPIDMNGDVSPNFLCSVQKELGLECDNGRSKNLKLAFVGSDSTVLIHDLTQGIAPLMPRRRKVVDAATVLAPAVWQHVNDQQEELVE